MLPRRCVQTFSVCVHWLRSAIGLRLCSRAYKSKSVLVTRVFSSQRVYFVLLFYVLWCIIGLSTDRSYNAATTWLAILLHMLLKRRRAYIHQFQVIHNSRCRCSRSSSQVCTTCHKAHLQHQVHQVWRQLPTTLQDLGSSSNLSSWSSVNRRRWSSPLSNKLRPSSATSLCRASSRGVAAFRVDYSLSF